jgi:hypothetical protein
MFRAAIFIPVVSFAIWKKWLWTLENTLMAILTPVNCSSGTCQNSTSSINSGDLRRVINLQPMHTLDLDMAIRLAAIELRSKDEARATSRIQAIQQIGRRNSRHQTSRIEASKSFHPHNKYKNNNKQQWSANPGNNSNRNKMTCIFCQKQGHKQDDCRKRINANQPCLDLSGKQFWPKVNTTENGAPIQALQDQDFQFWAWWNPYFKLLPSFLKLLWACVLFQLWLIINFQKLWHLFMGGNKIRPRINVTTGKKTFNWLFDTGTAITCMNADSFWESFGHSKPKLLKKSAGCISANGSRMDSMGIYKIKMTIRGRNILNPVTVVEDINDNILGIYFMHHHKLNHNSTSKQVTFAHMLTNA